MTYQQIHQKLNEKKPLAKNFDDHASLAFKCLPTTIATQRAWARIIDRARRPTHTCERKRIARRSRAHPTETQARTHAQSLAGPRQMDKRIKLNGRRERGLTSLCRAGCLTDRVRATLSRRKSRERGTIGEGLQSKGERGIVTE